MNKKQWVRYNRNIVNHSNGDGISFTHGQAELLLKLLNDMSNFVLLMQEDSPNTVNDPEVYKCSFDELCKTCDELDTKFIYRLQDKLNGKRG